MFDEVIGKSVVQDGVQVMIESYLGESVKKGQYTFRGKGKNGNCIVTLSEKEIYTALGKVEDDKFALLKSSAKAFKAWADSPSFNPADLKNAHKRLLNAVYDAFFTPQWIEAFQARKAAFMGQEGVPFRESPLPGKSEPVGSEELDKLLNSEE